MKQYINNTLGSLIKLLGSPHSYHVVIIASLAVAALLILLLCLATNIQSKANFSENITGTPETKIPTITPTKWWIKSTSVDQSIFPTDIASKNSADITSSNCPSSSSLSLQPGTYAYISLKPPIPNRVRASAGKANAYLGQIQPGKGIRIIDGPLCADSSFWLLIESTESRLRGWTVIGSGSQQWIIPCPDPNIACEKDSIMPTITPTTISTLAEENTDSRCNSNKFAIGMLAQVAEDNLLVVRSEPYTGIVLGRAEPMSTVRILDGPACAGNTFWWKVNLATLNLTGWVTEANLETCGKESDCS